MRQLSAAPSLVAFIYLVPISTWWLTELSIMPEPASPVLATFSSVVLKTLVTTQMLSLCLFVTRWSPVSIATSLLPAWPVLALLGLAAGITLGSLAITQAIIATTGILICGVAMMLRRILPDSEVMHLSFSVLGLAVAVLAWFLRGYWLQWVAS